MEQKIYLSKEQMFDLQSKLEKHLDDLLAGIKAEILCHVSEIAFSYLSEEDRNELLQQSEPIVL